MKRQRVDTVTGAVNSFKAAEKVAIPEHLNLDPTARMQWDLVTCSKAADSWTPNDLELVAEICIARSQKNQIRAGMRLADQDDSDPYKRLKVLSDGEKRVEDLVKREERLTRLLQLHPAATQGDARDQKKRNQAAQQARDALDDGDEFLASPIH